MKCRLIHAIALTNAIERVDKSEITAALLGECRLKARGNRAGMSRSVEKESREIPETRSFRCSRVKEDCTYVPSRLDEIITMCTTENKRRRGQREDRQEKEEEEVRSIRSAARMNRFEDRMHNYRASSLLGPRFLSAYGHQPRIRFPLPFLRRLQRNSSCDRGGVSFCEIESKAWNFFVLGKRVLN